MPKGRRASETLHSKRPMDLDQNRDHQSFVAWTLQRTKRRSYFDSSSAICVAAQTADSSALKDADSAVADCAVDC